MTRIFTPLLLLWSVGALASIPIAPMPRYVGALVHYDHFSDSATNGESTLVGWTNRFSVYPGGGTAYLRLMDSPDDPGVGLPLAPGSSNPRIATNGDEYLVGYSVGGGRFPVGPHVNGYVQRISPGGEPVGQPVVVNHSLFGGVTDVAWNGRQWLVAVNGDNASRVLLLDEELAVAATLELPAWVASLQNFGGRWWAVRQMGDAGVVEILPDGTAGAQWTMPQSNDSVRVSAAATPLFVFSTTDNRIDVATFDPGSGFGPRRPVLSGKWLHAAAPYGEHTLLIVTEPSGRDYTSVVVDASGVVIDTELLLDTDTYGAGAALGITRDGLTLFLSLHIQSTPRNTEIDLYSYPLRSLAPLRRETGALVSTAPYGTQTAPLIASNGMQAIAFWLQTLPDGTHAFHTRAVDADGVPFGEVTRLPLQAIPWTVPDISFDGERFFLVWSDFEGTTSAIHAATVSADGKTAGEPFVLGHGTAPSVASGAEGTFAVWRTADSHVRGTPLRSNGAPAVPDGFTLANIDEDFRPELAAGSFGFLLLVPANDTLQSIVLSSDGTVVRTETLASSAPDAIRSANRLAAWSSGSARGLQAFDANGRAAQFLVPEWGESWSPFDVDPIGTDRYLVTIGRHDGVMTSVVTLSGTTIVSVSPLRLFSRYEHPRIAVVHERSIGVYSDGQRVYVTTGGPAVRRRAVRH